MDIRSDILSLNPGAKFSGLMATKHWPWKHKQADDDVGRDPAKSCDIERYGGSTDCANLLDEKDKFCFDMWDLCPACSFATWKLILPTTSLALLKQTCVCWPYWSAVAQFNLLLFTDWVRTFVFPFKSRLLTYFCCKHSDKKKQKNTCSTRTRLAIRSVTFQVRMLLLYWAPAKMPQNTSTIIPKP